MVDEQITKICMHCYIRGYVQGVGFRYYTLRLANEYKINGWVRNSIDDSKVEVLACGLKSNIEQFVAHLKRGPSSAEVAEVICTEQPWQEFVGFSIE